MTAIKKQYKNLKGLAQNALKGFTLVELLVVVAILGILAAILILAINPAEANRKTRDSSRLSDIATMRQAADLAVVEGKASIPGSVLTPDTGNSTEANSRDADNSPANYMNMDVSAYLAVLPADPLNANAAAVTVSDGVCTPTPGTKSAGVGVMGYYWAADGTAYELNAMLESTSNCARLSTDGGNEGDVYEAGTDPTLNLMSTTLP